MPSSSNEVKAQFTADISSLVDGVNKASSTLQKGFAAAINDANKQFSALNAQGRKALDGLADTSKIQKGFTALSLAGQQQMVALRAPVEKAAESFTFLGRSTAKTKKDIREVGQSAVLAGNLIGGSLGNAVTTVGFAASATKGLVSSLTSAVGAAALVGAGLTALVGGLIYYISSSERSAAKTKVLSGTLEVQREELKKLKEAALEAATSLEVLRTKQENAGKVQPLSLETLPQFSIGDPAASSFPVPESFRERIALHEKEAIALREVAKAAAEEAATLKALDIIQDELIGSLRLINREYEIDGNQLQFLEAQTAAYTKAKKDALAVEGASAEVLENYSNSAKTSADSVERLKKEVEDLTQAQRDLQKAFEPGGHEFAGPLLKDSGLDANFLPSGPELKDAGPAKAADAIVPPNTDQLLQTRFDAIKSLVASNGAELTALTSSGLDLTLAAYNSFAQGVGDAVAAALIFQEDFGKAIEAVLKNVAAGIISALIQIGIQQLLLAAIGLTAAKAAGTAAGIRAKAEIGANAGIMFSSVAAGLTVASLGLGWKAALGSAGIASALLVAGSAAAGLAGAAVGKSVTALAEGGIATGPTLGLVGEAGREAIIPLDRLHEFIDKKSTQPVNLYLDGRLIATNTAKHLPGILRMHGVKG